MLLGFTKYKSSGNNFIIIDNRDRKYKFTGEQIKFLCDFKNGIGSDGLLVINKSKNLDFKVDFYNPDSTKAFCGNGSLCVLHYLRNKKVIGNTSSFSSLKKKYTAKLNSKISLKINDINSYSCVENGYFIDSGAPHHIRFVDDANSHDIENEAKLIRKYDYYKKKQYNLNLVSFVGSNSIYVRTFEKGVERETLSCGTGAVASVIASSIYKNISINKVITRGGKLNVLFNRVNNYKFTDIYLIGNPKEVFKGEITL